MADKRRTAYRVGHRAYPLGCEGCKALLLITKANVRLQPPNGDTWTRLNAIKVCGYE